jgi:hypothetical protein
MWELQLIDSGVLASPTMSFGMCSIRLSAICRLNVRLDVRPLNRMIPLTVVRVVVVQHDPVRVHLICIQHRHLQHRLLLLLCVPSLYHDYKIDMSNLSKSNIHSHLLRPWIPAAAHILVSNLKMPLSQIQFCGITSLGLLVSFAWCVCLSILLVTLDLIPKQVCSLPYPSARYYTCPHLVPSGRLCKAFFLDLYI